MDNFRMGSSYSGKGGVGVGWEGKVFQAEGITGLAMLKCDSPWDLQDKYNLWCSENEVGPGLAPEHVLPGWGGP